MAMTPGADSARPAPPDAAAPTSLVWPQRLSVAWLLTWSGLALWTAHGLATAWPYELHPLLIVLVIAMSGVMFRAGDLLFMRRRRRRLAGWWRAGARLAAVPVGVTAGCFLFPD